MTDDNCDGMRSPATACQPDPRSQKADIVTGEPLTLAYEHEKIAGIVLHDGVPRNIWAQFETSRNLYLYAWHVYRFYPVAEKQAYACLELALRERYRADIANTSKKKGPPGLSRLLKHAAQHGHLKNENFSVWRHRTVMRAKQRTKLEILQKMREQGLEEIAYDPEEFEITEQDRDHDYIQVVLDTVPLLRNEYAHGSDSLDNMVLGRIKMVAEIINQIYPQASTPGE